MMSLWMIELVKSHIHFQVHLFGMILLRMMAQVKSGSFVWYDVIVDD